MSLDVPVLDDRRFQDIVDEAKRRIPDRFPEWTNHNVSDPGVALIELFAWMTDMTLYRLNQMPDRAKAVLLDAIGFRQYPARAASADLTFLLSAPATQRLEIPAGTKVGTDTTLDGDVIFETEHTLELDRPFHERTVVDLASGGARERTGDIERLDGDPAARARATEPDAGGAICFDGLDSAWASWNRVFETLTERQRREWMPRERFAGDAIHFGFRRPLSDALVRVTVATTDTGGNDPGRPPILWEASTSNGWTRCTFTDRTGGLGRPGTIDVQLPGGHAVASVGDFEDLHWLRLRVDVGACPMYRTSPRLTGIGFSTVGGVARARHAELQPEEPLGTSTGRPAQRFVLGRPPVLTSEVGGVLDHAHADAEEPERTPSVTVDGEPWRRVADFANARPDDRVYVFDPNTGEIRFGPAVRQPDGTTRQLGAVPEEGARIVAPPYRRGGGRRGNVPAGRLRSLRSTVSFVDRVENRRAALGGVDAESMDDALNRAPSSVFAGDRAVTTDDFVRIVLDAAPELRKVAPRRPSVPGGPLRLLVVPDVVAHPSVQHIDHFALAAELCERIERHLEPRRLIGQRCEITTPYYQGVSVAVRVRIAPPDDADTSANDADDRALVRDRVIEELYRFVNPIVGGERRSGLDFGAVLTSEILEAVVRSVQGVRDVVDIAMFDANLRSETRLGRARRRIVAKPDALFLSFRHRVIVESEDDAT